MEKNITRLWNELCVKYNRRLQSHDLSLMYLSHHPYLLNGNDIPHSTYNGSVPFI